MCTNVITGQTYTGKQCAVETGQSRAHLELATQNQLLTAGYVPARPIGELATVYIWTGSEDRDRFQRGGRVVPLKVVSDWALQEDIEPPRLPKTPAQLRALRDRHKTIHRAPQEPHAGADANRPAPLTAWNHASMREAAEYVADCEELSLDGLDLGSVSEIRLQVQILSNRDAGGSLYTVDSDKLRETVDAWQSSAEYQAYVMREADKAQAEAYRLGWY